MERIETVADLINFNGPVLDDDLLDRPSILRSLDTMKIPIKIPIDLVRYRNWLAFQALIYSEPHPDPERIKEGAFIDLLLQTSECECVFQPGIPKESFEFEGALSCDCVRWLLDLAARAPSDALCTLALAPLRYICDTFLPFLAHKDRTGARPIGGFPGLIAALTKSLEGTIAAGGLADPPPNSAPRPIQWHFLRVLAFHLLAAAHRQSRGGALGSIIIDSDVYPMATPPPPGTVLPASADMNFNWPVTPANIVSVGASLEALSSVPAFAAASDTFKLLADAFARDVHKLAQSIAITRGEGGKLNATVALSTDLEATRAFCALVMRTRDRKAAAASLEELARCKRDATFLAQVHDSFDSLKALLRIASLCGRLRWLTEPGAGFEPLTIVLTRTVILALKTNFRDGLFNYVKHFCTAMQHNLVARAQFPAFLDRTALKKPMLEALQTAEAFFKSMPSSTLELKALELVTHLRLRSLALGAAFQSREEIFAYLTTSIVRSSGAAKSAKTTDQDFRKLMRLLILEEASIFKNDFSEEVSNIPQLSGPLLFHKLTQHDKQAIMEMNQVMRFERRVQLHFITPLLPTVYLSVLDNAKITLRSLRKVVREQAEWGPIPGLTSPVLWLNNIVDVARYIRAFTRPVLPTDGAPGGSRNATTTVTPDREIQRVRERATQILRDCAAVHREWAQAWRGRPGDYAKIYSDCDL